MSNTVTVSTGTVHNVASPERVASDMAQMRAREQKALVMYQVPWSELETKEQQNIVRALQTDHEAIGGWPPYDH